MKSTAAVSRGATAPFTIETITLDDPRGDEILVRVSAVGICHTDLAVRGMWPEGAPIVLGHEGAGVVEKVGTEVKGVQVGDHVVMSFASCQQCAACSAGLVAYCERFAAANVSGARLDGTPPLSGTNEHIAGAFFGQSSFSQFALTRASNVVVIDSSVDLAHAASFGCGIQTGAGAVVNVLKPTASSSVVVFGAGGVGMAAIMASKILGVETVVAVDLSRSRREVALTVGATHALDGADPGLLASIQAITGGGATHAFDTTGVPSVVRTALQALRSLGTLVLVGTGPDLTFASNDLIGGGKTLRGCIEGDATPQNFIPQLVRWYLEGRLPMDQIVRTFPFASINEAVAQAIDGSIIKPVLTFDR